MVLSPGCASKLSGTQPPRLLNQKLQVGSSSTWLFTKSINYEGLRSLSKGVGIYDSFEIAWPSYIDVYLFQQVSTAFGS